MFFDGEAPSGAVTDRPLMSLTTVRATLGAVALSASGNKIHSTWQCIAQSLRSLGGIQSAFSHHSAVRQG